MITKRFEVEPIGYVESGREDLEDDKWGGEQACIVLDNRFTADALRGVDSFSHVEVLFLFHRVEAGDVVQGVRHPRDNQAWPAVGIFAQRAKTRPNRIGSTICRLIRTRGRRLYVAELDAIAGTPVLDIKPVLSEFLPRGEMWQPTWSRELMSEYWRRKA